MKKMGVVIFLYASFMSIGLSLAVNGSYCCPNPSEVIRAAKDGEDGKYGCMDPATSVRTKITLACADKLNTALETRDADFIIKLSPEGKLLFMLDKDTEFISIPAGQFCLGHRLKNGTVNTSVAIVCEDSEEPEVVSDEVLGYCMAVSGVFLALTVLVYILLPELRDLQGKSIINLCSSLAVANIIMSVLKVMEYSDMQWCAVRGFVAYFFLISSFFWMNTLAVQILLSIKRSSVCNHGREFLWYALYAWGTPALCTVVLIVLNYHPGHHIKPGIGQQHCWFLDIQRMWIFMYSIMSILITVNVFIFIYTSVYLWRHTFASSHVKAMKYKFSIMLRLFILMGLPWIFEMVSTLTPTHIVWVVIDFTNCLQGILIFVILVVFRRRVIKALHKRNALCCLNDVAEKYLAQDAHDEDDMVTHTIAVPLEDK